MLLEHPAHSTAHLSTIREILDDQLFILQELRSLGLNIPPQVTLAATLHQAEEAHMALSTTLGIAGNPIEWDEKPTHHLWNHQGTIGFVSRTVAPNAKRRNEKTADGRTVDEHLSEWALKNHQTPITTCHVRMKAGVANCGVQSKYTPMQILAFSTMIQEAIQEQKDLLVASTVRNVGVDSKPSSSILIQRFASTYLLPHGDHTVLTTMQRPTPTELWAMFVKQDQLILLRNALIHAFNERFIEKEI